MHYNNVKFGVFTDLHLDIMHDGKIRLEEFMKRMNEENVDFIIQLGDFCYPGDTQKCLCSSRNLPINLKNAMEAPTDIPKKELLNMFNGFEKPHYHVLGNHEFDFCSKEKAMEFYGMKNRYYSFICKGWKFIVLDGSNFKNNEGLVKDYEYGDYFDYTDLPYIDSEQVKWLEKELLSDELPILIFSHQPLNESVRGIKNALELSNLFKRANENKKKVRLCINGHTHVDKFIKWNGVGYYTLNSMSNHWAGTKYAKCRFSDEIEAVFPNLKYTFPYKKPLYAIITLNEKGAYIEGIEGEFFNPNPQEVGYIMDIEASIKSREILW